MLARILVIIRSDSDPHREAYDFAILARLSMKSRSVSPTRRAKVTGHWHIGGKLIGVSLAGSVSTIEFLTNGCRWCANDSGSRIRPISPDIRLSTLRSSLPAALILVIDQPD